MERTARDDAREHRVRAIRTFGARPHVVRVVDISVPIAREL